MTVLPDNLPGHDLVREGTADLARGRETTAALLVAMAAPRLRALDVDVPEGGGDRPSHRLYDLFSDQRPATGVTALTVSTTRWSAAWMYTGGTAWLWLLPTLVGVGLVGLNFRARRREWKPMDAAAVVGLIAALLVGVGYVTWEGLADGLAAGLNLRRR